MPLIIFDPRAPLERRGQVADQMVLNIDIAPTILAYAGVGLPGHYQGRNLLPIMNGKELVEWSDDTFAEHLMEHAQIPKWEGVRGQRYGYARYYRTGTGPRISP